MHPGRSTNRAGSLFCRFAAFNEISYRDSAFYLGCYCFRRVSMMVSDAIVDDRAWIFGVFSLEMGGTRLADQMTPNIRKN